ncbi:MAG TPA: LPS export ABC transporter periplasmic protein LptC [Terriglobales bacterium]|nr:LPS export ABC transporter periplasmic protein LptC [Terriglobales bacterium]
MEISRLRRWFAISLAALGLLVAGAYFYATRRVPNALKQVPEKINVEIQQNAHGFTFSRSAEGRTLFKIQASQAIQFKQGGRVELHDVTITLFGRDSTRFDQIYGAAFDYDPQSGDVVGKGEVQIDLQSNPEGVANPDQAPPKELKNPIHLRTTGLTFNQKTGNASTDQKIDFNVPQATGSAIGVTYIANTGVLTMKSQVTIKLTNRASTVLTADHGTITKNPHIVVLEQARLRTKTQQAQARRATLFLRPDNTLERVLAERDVLVESDGPPPTRVTADQSELVLTGTTHSLLQTATFTGNVHMESNGPQPMQGFAARAFLTFSGKNVLTAVHTDGNVRLLQHPRSSTTAENSSRNPQDMELTAPAMDFLIAEGRRLKTAETSGPPQLTIQPATGNTGQLTVITAKEFTAHFDDLGQMTSAHGSPDARIVSKNPGQPDRVSTSEQIDASFRPGSGVEVLVQQGNVVYADAERKAWGEKARYTPSDQILTLTGSPRVIDGSMTTTARTMRLNRATGEAFADGDVRTTYSELKVQPDGAMLASSSPIHVTSHSMTARQDTKIALYTGDARLWQDANLVTAPSIEFNDQNRSMRAQSAASQPVSTILVQTEKDGKTTAVRITSDFLTYTDDAHLAHFQGNVQAKSPDVIVTSAVMDVYLVPRGQGAPGQSLSQAARIDHIVATDQVVVTQPQRRGTGEKLVYTAADDKFVLTGGPPCIFDAEQGKTTGVSLTLFRHDDRVLVEGNNTSPTVTHTRVAR